MSWRRRLDEMSRRRAAVLAIIPLLIAVYFGFTKHVPFTHGFRVNAYFKDAVSIKPNSAVRIAGVNVGKVVAVDRDGGSPYAKVVFDLDDSALPLHTDATAKIRSRIMLEGNFFVDLKPGTPSAPVLESGDSLPVAQTAAPVQIDRVLSALDNNARTGLATFFEEIGKALDAEPTPEEDADQDPDVHGKTGAEALNGSLRYSPRALRGAGRVFKALAGTERGDQRRILRGLRGFSDAINQREAQVTTLIGAFSTTVGAYADDEEQLRELVRQFSALSVESASSVRRIGRVFPPLSRYSREFSRTIGELPATLVAAEPWIDQVTELLQEDELQGLLADARPTFDHFAGAAAEGVSTLPRFNRLALCYSGIINPALNVKIEDDPHSSGVENYKEFWYQLVGAAGEAQNFNANGPYLRLAGGGTERVSTPNGLVGNALRPKLGVRPNLPLKANGRVAVPDQRHDVPCHSNALPDVNALGRR